jgi:hypothetical protein
MTTHKNENNTNNETALIIYIKVMIFSNKDAIFGVLRMREHVQNTKI